MDSAPRIRCGMPAGSTHVALRAANPRMIEPSPQTRLLAQSPRRASHPHSQCRRTRTSEFVASPPPCRAWLFFHNARAAQVSTQDRVTRVRAVKGAPFRHKVAFNPESQGSPVGRRAQNRAAAGGLHAAEAYEGVYDIALRTLISWRSVSADSGKMPCIRHAVPISLARIGFVSHFGEHILRPC